MWFEAGGADSLAETDLSTVALIVCDVDLAFFLPHLNKLFSSFLKRDDTIQDTTQDSIPLATKIGVVENYKSKKRL